MGLLRIVKKGTNDEVSPECEHIKTWFVVSLNMTVLECFIAESGIEMCERNDLEAILI